MFLFVLAQDICEVEIGLSNNRELIFCSTFAASPEEYLNVIDTYLKQHNVQKQDIEGVYIVTGPGSFTASRVSITLANSFAFAQGIPIFEIQNSTRKALSDLMVEVLHNNVPSSVFARPFYDKPPQITKETK